MRRKLLHLLILCSLAFAQPLLNVLAHNSTFFVAHGSMPADLFALVLLLELIFALLFAGVEALLGLIHPGAHESSHAFFVALLSALIALPLLNRTILPAAAILLIAVFIGILTAFLYFRWKPLPTFLTFLSPAILLVPLLFFLNPQIRSLLAEERKEESRLAKIKNKVPIVFLVLDELPLTSLMDAQHVIDAVRYPNFARLAHDSTWFRDASAVSMLTHSAVPAILTGKYPAEWKSPTIREYPTNLFTVLEDSYQMHAFETVTRLAPRKASEGEREDFLDRMKFLLADSSALYLHIILPDTLAARLPSVTDTWDDFWGQANASDTIHPRRDRTEFFARFLKSIQPTNDSQLYFLHVMLPHRPWRYLPSGREYEDEVRGTYGSMGDGGRAKWLPDPEFAIEGYQRHLLQLCFVDKLLGRLLDELKKDNLYDRSLIILTADHGCSFWPGEFLRMPTPANYQDILMVPLFVKMPGQKMPRTNDESVETVDILPTIAQVLGIRLPDKVDGTSLFAANRKPHPKRMVVRGQLRDYPTDLETQTKTLDRKLELFGSNLKPEELFQIGASRDLIGKHVSDLQLTSASTNLWQQNVFQNVNLSIPVLPVLISGELVNAGAEKIKVAVAVNGIIRAITETEARNPKKFRALVPDNSFRSGFNKVEIFYLK